jgi:hypothetical protein
VHQDVAATVDIILRGAVPRPELRQREADGGVSVTEAPRIEPFGPRDNGRSAAGRSSARGPAGLLHFPNEASATPSTPAVAQGAVSGVASSVVRGRGTEAKPLRIYAFGVSRNRLEQAIQALRLPAVVVRESRDADVMMTLKNYYRQKAQPIKEAESRGVPVYVLRSNTSIQMEQLLSSLFPPRVEQPADAPEAMDQEAIGPRRNGEDGDPLLAAITEAEEAIAAVMNGGDSVQLSPQGTRIRQIQHQLAERYALSSRSRGREPNRRVEISRDGSG